MPFNPTILLSALFLLFSGLHAGNQTNAASADAATLLIFGALGFVVVVSVIIVLQRMKTKKRPLPGIEETAAPVEEPKSEPVEAEARTAPEAAEPLEEATTAAAAPAPEAPEPIVEPETVTVPEETALKPEPGRRKKRDLSERPETVTKDNLTEFAGNRILVAEDNMINQKVIAKLLEGSGIELVMAENGQVALDILAKDQNFGMVLMDAHMPVKDGFEASREIRENPLYDAIVVVALSGDVSTDDIRKMKEAGMEEQLAKPLRVDALYDVMYQYLDFPGASGTSEEEASPSAKTSEGSVFNIEEGVQVCGGDETMFNEILDEFIQTYKNMDVLADSLIDAQDFDKLSGLMLDVHGLAGNIGAERLSYSSEMLREALLAGESENYDSLLSAVKTDLKALLEAVGQYRAAR